MEHAIVNVNGRIYHDRTLSLASTHIHVYDRSFLYGDSLYEVVRSYKGKFMFMKEHLDRLEKSAKLCRLRITQRLSELSSEMEKTYAFYKRTQVKRGAPLDVYCRIVLSRGTGKIGFAQSNVRSGSTFAIYVQPLVQPSPKDFERGYNLTVVTRLRNDPRALDPAMKSGNYLNSVLAYFEGTDTGADDALMANADGHLTEGTTFNIFYVRNGMVATPPLDIGILDGITRREILKASRKVGIETREVRFPREYLYAADEVFISSTLKDAFPVTKVDGKKIADGKPGRVTRLLKQAMVDFYERHA